MTDDTDLLPVGVASVRLYSDGCLEVCLTMQDGSTRATHWDWASLKHSCALVAGPKHPPTIRAAVN